MRTSTVLRPRGAPRRLLQAAMLAAMCGLPLVCAAEIYGWVDANGDVTYSNLPPPPGARLTDVIHEKPLSPQAVSEAEHRSEVNALKDRLRLLEFEVARGKRQVADNPAPPPAPAGVPCDPQDATDCGPPSYDYGPYLTTGLLYGGYGGYGGFGAPGGDGHHHDHDRGHDHGHGGGPRPVHHAPPALPAATPVHFVVHGGGGPAAAQSAYR